MNVKTGIIGATGYGGYELVRLLSAHPRAELAYLATRSEQRPRISQIHPALLGVCDMVAEPIDLDEMADRSDVVFLSVPHTAAFEHVPGLLERGVKVIDLSADYRLRDVATYERWYEVSHGDPGNLARAAYGLTELFADEVRGADLVAVPGCYPTGVVLGAWPLLRKGLVEPDFIADAKSGVTGAGKKLTLTTHFPEANESVSAYKVGAHRHTPEMEQALSAALGGGEVHVEFVPHLAPMDRGIESTLYFTPRGAAGAASEEQVASAFEEAYEGEPFVRLRGGEFPRTRDVSYTNFCDLAWKVTSRHVVVSSVIDNLVKGAAGQAVECMNLVCGFERTEGLL